MRLATLSECDGDEGAEIQMAMSRWGGQGGLEDGSSACRPTCGS